MCNFPWLILLSIVFPGFSNAQISSFCPALPNSTGEIAQLSGAFGSGVGSGLHLEVSGGVPGEFGYILVGNEATFSTVLGNGLLCLAGTSTANVYRYGTSIGTDTASLGRFDSAGIFQNLSTTSSYGSGFDVPSTIPSTVPISITAGSTWHFQCWYRDSAALLGMSNLSNGIRVPFRSPATEVSGLVSIPPGAFEMGSHAAPGWPYYSGFEERPVHLVSITHPYWMGRHEVTQAEYLSLMGNNPSTWVGNLNRPVEMVSWDDARAYCAVLTAQQTAIGNVPVGYEFRLPTEAEWEYACRAGTISEYSTGPSLLCSDARIYLSYHTQSSCNNIPPGPAPVETYAPNPWGLYDMHGNISEWCLDTYQGYSPNPGVDPFSTGMNVRTYRGGNYGFFSNHARSASRNGNTASFAEVMLGFRVVMAPILAP